MMKEHSSGILRYLLDSFGSKLVVSSVCSATVVLLYASCQYLLSGSLPNTVSATKWRENEGQHEALLHNPTTWPHPCDFIVGERNASACSYLERVFPTKSRIPSSDVEELHFYRPQRDILVPLCLLTFPNTETENIMYHFAKPVSNSIFYNSRPGERAFSTPSLTLGEDDLTISAVLWLNMDSGQSVKLLLREEDLDGVQPLRNLPVVANLSREMMPNHLWPSGHFLRSSKGYFAAVHQGQYGVGIFKWINGTFMRLKTTGFEDAGGENIGTLFEQDGELYLSVRVNLRYHLRSHGGHGYRYPGIYKLKFQSGKTNGSLPHVSGSLVVQHSDDSKCCAECGGCFDAKRFSRCCEVDADIWWRCLEYPRGVETRTWSLNRNTTCQFDAVRSVGKCSAKCSFSSYYTCVHGCRDRGEKYHSAVTTLGGGLSGLISDRHDNGVTLCRLGNKSLKYVCYETPLLHLKSSLPTHPVMSGLLETRNKLVFLEMVLKDLQAPEPKSRTTVAHSWQRHNFCSLMQKNPNIAGYATIRVLSSANHANHVTIIFSHEAESYSCKKTCTSVSAKDRVKMSLNHRNSRHYLVSASPKESALSTSDLCLCSQHFGLEQRCSKGCELRVEFQGVRLRGVTGS